jgi:hypothetical protein
VNEEELIRALVNDSRSAVPMLRVERQFGRLLLVGVAVVAVFTRAGMAVSGDVVLLPVLVFLTMFCAGAMGAVVSSVPGRTSWRLSATLVIAALVVWTADTTVRATSALRVAGEAWGDASWIKCMGFTTGVSLVAAVVLFRVIRRGWPVRPRLTAALTFVSGASAAALTTTLECPSNAPLHVLFGHMMPVLAVTLLGTAAAASFFGRSASLESLDLNR